MTELTADPLIFIEEQRSGYVRYRRSTDGRRWEVWGTCDHRGDCLIGTSVRDERGEWEMIRDHAHIEELKQRLGVDRLDFVIDVPVLPEFDTCCGAERFHYVEL